MSGVHRIVSDTKAVWRVADRHAALRWTFAIPQHVGEIVRTRSLASADASLRPRSVRCKVGGISVLVPGIDFPLVREMYCRGVYWPDAGFLPRMGDVVVDLGANVGLFTVFAALSGADVVAVEAQSGFAERFWRLVCLNGVAERVSLVHAIVGGSEGVFSTPQNRAASPEWIEEPQSLEFGELLAGQGIAHIDLLKADIEGSEFALLRDASCWLGAVDRIAIEVHATYGAPNVIAQTLRNDGFSVRQVTRDLRIVDPLTDTGFIYGVRRT